MVCDRGFNRTKPNARKEVFWATFFKKSKCARSAADKKIPASIGVRVEILTAQNQMRVRKFFGRLFFKKVVKEVRTWNQKHRDS